MNLTIAKPNINQTIIAAKELCGQIHHTIPITLIVISLIGVIIYIVSNYDNVEKRREWFMLIGLSITFLAGIMAIVWLTLGVGVIK